MSKGIVSITDSTPKTSDLDALMSEGAGALSERDSEQVNQSRLLASQCAQVADELRGSDIVVLDLTKITPEFDCFVIVTGSSRRQLHAIVEEADRMMVAKGSKRISVEGYDSNQWILQDYGDVVIHAFDAEARELYNLERLWGDAEKIDWKQFLSSQS